MIRQRVFTLITFILLCLSGCAGFPLQNPRDRADQLANKNGFHKREITTKKFCFTSYQKTLEANKPITIYIEGDGRSQITPILVSDDPTPLNPVALKLAVLDKNPNVVYLARPCQYTPIKEEKACRPEIWTHLRFSESIIASINEAIDKIKDEAKSSKIHLVGFSGGAAVAVLIAARREDVGSLKTVAGDLDHVAMSAYHQTTPLQGSLNPKDFAQKIAHIPQYHFVGDQDPIVPQCISQGFVAAIPKEKQNHINRTVLKGVFHHEGWEERWGELLKRN